MKKYTQGLVLATAVFGVSAALAQNNTPWTTTGNIGIGTTSPQTNLHLRSTDAYSPQLLLDNAGGAGAGYLIFQKTKSSQAALAPGDGLGTILSTAFANGAFQQSSYLTFSVDAPTSGSNVFGALTFVSRNADGSASEKFRVSSSGNVGLGTAAPDAKLVIAGNSDAATYWTDAQLHIAGASDPRMQLDLGYDTIANVGVIQAGQAGVGFKNLGLNPSGGNVGIGTTSPYTVLDVRATGGSDPFRVRGSAHNASVELNSGQGFYLSTVEDADAGGTTRDSVALCLRGKYWTGSSSVSAISSIQNFVVGNNRYFLAFRTANTSQMVIDQTGNVGIGTTNPTQKLSVNGTIRAKEVVVETSGWSDYVFADNYVLQPLSEVETQIKQNKHLPGIPSAQQVAESGVGLGEMQAKLLAKIEELTLHQIEQDKRIRALEAENAKLRRE